MNISSNKKAFDTLKLILLFLLLWFVTSELVVYIHEFSHGIVTLIVGARWEALYVNPVQGFVTTRSNDFQDLFIVFAGTLGVFSFGLSLFFIQKKIKNPFIRIFMLCFSFYGATEPIIYWGMQTISYLTLGDGYNVETDFGDPGIAISLGISPYLIIIITIIIVILFLPPVYRQFYVMLKPEFNVTLSNTQKLFYLMFIPFQILKGLLVFFIQNSGIIATLVIYSIYGFIFAGLGFIVSISKNKDFPIRKKQQNREVETKQNDVNEETTSKSEMESNPNHEDMKKSRSKHVKKQSLIRSDWLNKKQIFSTHRIKQLSIAALILTTIWIGVFGFSVESSVGLNWNEDPYASNININVNNENTVDYEFLYHPDFPANLRKMVFNWELYIDQTIEFSNIMISPDSITASNLSQSIHESNDFWMWNQNYKNSRSVKVENPVEFNQIQNLTAIPGLIMYNITDPWKFNNENSFIDQFQISWDGEYALDSVNFYNYEGAMEEVFYSTGVNSITLKNENAEDAPLIIEMKLSF